MDLQNPESSILASIYQSSKQNKKRDLYEDSLTFLNTHKIDFKISYKIKTLGKTPTLVVVNHFTRPLIKRKVWLTTFDSLITSALASVAHKKIAKRKLTWVTKNDLKTNIFFISVKMRKIQLAVIDVYNFLGVGKHYPFNNQNKWVEYINDGYDIGFYPEATTGTKMRPAKKRFVNILEFLKSQKMNFQVLPISIYEKNKKFYLTVNKTIKSSNNSVFISQHTMLSIAASLPKSLRGHYKNKVSNLATTGK